MISEFLIAKIKERFPDRLFTQGTPPEAVITFPSFNSEVGDLKIYDDGDEVQVEIAKITHGHFGCWEENLSQARREENIAESVTDFIEKVFNERVIFFSTVFGIGGWKTLKDNEPNKRRPLTNTIRGQVRLKTRCTGQSRGEAPISTFPPKPVGSKDGPAFTSSGGKRSRHARDAGRPVGHHACRHQVAHQAA